MEASPAIPPRLQALGIDRLDVEGRIRPIDDIWDSINELDSDAIPDGHKEYWTLG